ncbi:MAG: hypothetical protein G01um101449_545 [Parcubacteria group bacterium Gr01-1014_49]|nr:MAG: hypothetical protein G01um101449_545 [Parcubacteria group bacterium Gr01-1014_49]
MGKEGVRRVAVALLVACALIVLIFEKPSKGALEEWNMPPEPTLSDWHEKDVVTVVKKAEKLPGSEEVWWTVVQIGPDPSNRYPAQVASSRRDLALNTPVKVKKVAWNNNRRHSVPMFPPESLLVQ